MPDPFELVRHMSLKNMLALHPSSTWSPSGVFRLCFFSSPVLSIYSSWTFLFPIVARSAERSEARSADYSVQTGRHFGTLSVCLCVSPFWGTPVLGSLWCRSSRNLPSKHVPIISPRGVQLLEPAIHRSLRVLAIKMCSKLCFVAICRHHTPMGIFKLPVL